MHRICFVLLLSFLSADQVTAQGLSQEIREKLDSAVLAEMKKQDLVGVSVGVIRNGKVLYTKGFGMADRENKIAFTSKTVTNWASNSKPVVAIRTMQLVEQGNLKLSDGVRQYIPELPKHCDPITIRHLLCHQSGYPHYSNGRVLKLAKPIQSDQGSLDPVFSINRFGGSPLLREPEADYSYSSYAYVILSAILQRAGKEPLPKQLQRCIVAPNKMISFGLDEKFDNQKNWSVGYKRNLFGKVDRVAEYANDWKHGAGAYKSNIEDFAKWAAALIDGKLVTKKSESQMWTAQKLASGKQTNVGLGFFVDGKENTLKVFHGGSHSEARSLMVIYPRQKHGIVVLCNCGHASPAKISTAMYQVLQ